MLRLALTRITRLILWLGLLCLTVAVVGLTWLRFESHRLQDAYMDTRKGVLTGVERTDVRDGEAVQSEAVTLSSDTGLTIFARVLRAADASDAPVLLILGGHRTGRDAVDLFDNVRDYTVVALDYPYRGPQRIRGVRQTLQALPLARQAFLDTPPAVALVLDWLDDQSWARGPRLLIGASLGVPFAVKTAARDTRVDGVILVHGAADNERWLTVQVARRVDATVLHRPLGTLLHWLAYGPTFDSAANVARIAPRPTLVIGARQDERTPPDEVQALFDATLHPKRLRWTEGLHIETGRTDVVDQMMQIAGEELPFLLAGESAG